MSEEKVLLRLRRQYSRDEAIAFLSTKLKERDFRIGELTSEVEEFKHLLSKEQKKKQQVKEIHIDPQTKKQWRRDDACKEFTREIEAQKIKILNLNNEVKFWRDKYFTLKDPILTADVKSYVPIIDPPIPLVPLPRLL